jgi:hypothetical protein
VKRREFITLLGGAAAAWPVAARAQQPERMRRIGVLMSAVEGDQRGLESITAFAQGLAELGWTVGRNVRSNTAGAPVISSAFADPPRSWSRSRPMSCWLPLGRSWARFSRNPACSGLVCAIVAAQEGTAT